MSSLSLRDDSNKSLPKMSSQDLEKYVLPMIQKKITQRSCKGPISIKRVDPKGDYIVIENTCAKKPIVLTNWTLRRRGVDVPINSFKFEKHFVLHPNRTVKIYAKDKGRNNPPHELMSDSVTTWGVGTYAFTQLVNHLDQEKANLLEKVEHYERDLQIPVNRVSDSHQRSSTSMGRGDRLDFESEWDKFDQYGYTTGSGKKSLADFNSLKNNSTDYEFHFERHIWPS